MRERRCRLRRRDFIVLASTAAILPLSVFAQHSKIPVVGVLVVGSPGSERFWQLFREDMRDLGYIEGQSIRFEFRSDQGQSTRLAELAAELVRLRVDLLVTWFTPAATAAKQATSEIPIVMALAGNPVETGLVQTLARPGGNVTGLAGVGAELAGKSVELIKEMLPTARRVVALANAPDPFSKPFVDRIQFAGKAAGIIINPVMIHTSDELELAFAAMEVDRPDAAIVQGSLPTKRVADLGLRHRIPMVSIIRGFVDEGGLMSFVAAEADMYRRTAVYADKVLKGANPADLPIEQPTIELVINLKTARALGLTIPSALLTRADEVIE